MKFWQFSAGMAGLFILLGALPAAAGFNKAGKAALSTAQSGQDSSQVRLIPQPVHIQIGNGSCQLSNGYTMILPAHIKGKSLTALKKVVAVMDAQLRETLGRRVSNVATGAVPVKLILDPALRWAHSAVKHIRQQNEQGYQLKVTASGIQIAARTNAGLYYGMQSLLQLAAQNSEHQVPFADIEDFPQYSWRGFMLDVSRHFYTVEEIKRLLDVMSRYKLNIFHWHLTDDQGWRLEIKRYPRLTSVAAWREEIPGSVFFNKRPDTLKGRPYRYGGFYTQKQARDIVQYAAVRGITVVPEIELPGHAEAALAAYPEFSTSGFAQPVANSMGYAPGAVSEYNPGNPKTFDFLENVLKEVMAIFPSPYIHIGGDEVDKTHWKNNASCQALLKKEGLKDYEQLQSYFINKIGRFVEKKGRKIIGWDEALEGNLLPSAAITYWRSYAKKAPLKAVSGGHAFINVCSDPLYFNRYQADPEGEPLAAPHSINTLERVYGYQVTPAGFTPDEQKLVLGGQAAIWTEFFNSGSQMEYMLLPRLLAFAENLWTPGRAKDYNAFYQALPRELAVLGRAGYNYRKLDK